MTIRKYLILAICAISFFVSSVNAQQENKQGLVIVGNVDINGNLKIDSNKNGPVSTLPLKGRLNFYLEVPLNKLLGGPIDLKGFSLIFYDVPQKKITGQDAAKTFGTLGMPMSPSKKWQAKFDFANKTINLEVPVQAHFPQIDEIMAPRVAENTENDYSISKTQNGIVKLQITINESLSSIAVKTAISKWVEPITGKTSAQIDIEPLDDSIPGYGITFNDIGLRVQAANRRGFTGAPSLCIQPVRFAEGTGGGFEFGRPLIEVLWKNYGIAVSYKKMLPLPDPGSVSQEMDESEVESVLRYNDPDCIEIFFVRKFLPLDLYGGGKTFASGTINAKIITSDTNMTCNIDFTHLAHEMGHVLGLGHPGEQDGLSESSHGTLMCPSDLGFDNLQINSRANVRTAVHHFFAIIVDVPFPQGLCDTQGRRCAANCPTIIKKSCRPN